MTSQHYRTVTAVDVSAQLHARAHANRPAFWLDVIFPAGLIRRHIRSHLR